MIGKFQNLFKSNPSSSSTSSGKRDKSQVSTTVNPVEANNNTQEVPNCEEKATKTVELINYQKKRFDSPTYNDSVK